MKTIAAAVVFLTLTTSAWADDQDSKSATADEPILLSEAEMDTITAGASRIIEVHTVGQDNWTTLPDANGHSTSTTDNFIIGTSFSAPYP